MKAEEVNAWFLHSQASGDTSLRTYFFTNEYGIIQALYKGGRTPKKQQYLQPFSPLWLFLNSRNDWYYVRHIENHSRVMALQGEALFAGLYVNEIVFAMLKPLDASPRLFTVYEETLDALSRTHDRLSIEPVLRRFERTLLEVTGYGIPLIHEAYSNRQIEATQFYRLIVGVGFVLSNEGFPGSHILAFAAYQFDDVAVLLTAKRIMRAAINHALDGRQIHARKLWGVK